MGIASLSAGHFSRANLRRLCASWVERCRRLASTRSGICGQRRRAATRWRSVGSRHSQARKTAAHRARRSSAKSSPIAARTACASTPGEFNERIERPFRFVSEGPRQVRQRLLFLPFHRHAWHSGIEFQPLSVRPDFDPRPRGPRFLAVLPEEPVCLRITAAAESGSDRVAQFLAAAGEIVVVQGPAADPNNPDTQRAIRMDQQDRIRCLSLQWSPRVVFRLGGMAAGSQSVKLGSGLSLVPSGEVLQAHMRHPPTFDQGTPGNPPPRRGRYLRGNPPLKGGVPPGVPPCTRRRTFPGVPEYLFPEYLLDIQFTLFLLLCCFLDLVRTPSDCAS